MASSRFGPRNGEGLCPGRKDGAPVLFAAVVLEGTTFGVSTDIQGYYSLSKVPAGTYTLVVSSVEYKPFRTEVVVLDDRVFTQNITLEAGSSSWRARSFPRNGANSSTPFACRSNPSSRRTSNAFPASAARRTSCRCFRPCPASCPQGPRRPALHPRWLSRPEQGLARRHDHLQCLPQHWPLQRLRHGHHFQRGHLHRRLQWPIWRADQLHHGHLDPGRQSVWSERSHWSQPIRQQAADRRAARQAQ